MKRFLLPSLFFFASILTCQAQKDFSLSVGAGIPEMVNGGVRFGFQQFQIGATIGTLPGGGSLSFSNDFYLHFGHSRKRISRQNSYLKMGWNYSREETETSIRNFVFICVRIGHEFYLNDQFGIGIDGGIGVPIAKNESALNPNSTFNYRSNDVIIIPCLGLNVFYKFKMR